MPSTTRSANAGEDLVFSGGIPPPVYEQPLSVAHSCQFYKNYTEYERRVKLSNNGQTVQRPLLKLSELLPKNVRRNIARMYYTDHKGKDLVESDLKQGLAQHGECWTDSEVNATKVVAEVKGLLAMGSEATAVDRFDAVQGRLEEYFENPHVERVFRDSEWNYESGPARVITAAVVRGLKPRAFKEHVDGILELQGRTWKENPDELFALVRAQAVAWRLVEKAEASQRQRRGKSTADGQDSQLSPTTKQEQQTDKCWNCGQLGHRKHECPSRGKGGSTQPSEGDGNDKKPAARSQGQQQDARGEAQPRGTPALRGGSQQKPAATAGRVAVWDGPGWTDLPPKPVPPGQSENLRQSVYEPEGIKIVGGRSASVSVAAVSSQFDEAQTEPTGMVSPKKGVIKVDLLGKHGCFVAVSVQGIGRCYTVKGEYDSGAGINAISAKLVREMQVVFPGVQLVESMNKSLKVRAVDGRDVVVTECTCPLRLAIHTPNGPHVANFERLVVLPGEDDVLIIGRPMLRDLFGLDIPKMVAERVLADNARRAKDKRLETEALMARISEEKEAIMARISEAAAEKFEEPDGVANVSLMNDPYCDVGNVNEQRGDGGDVILGASKQDKNDFHDWNGDISFESDGEEDHECMCAPCREGIT